MQAVPARRFAPTTPTIVTVGTINGGTAGNVVAGEVKMTGTLRALDMDVMAELKSATQADFKEILPQILNSVAQKKLGDAVSIAGGALLDLVKTHSGDIIKAITNT